VACIAYTKAVDVIWQWLVLSAVLALSFRYVVEQQPIGHELFQEFCDTKPHLKKAVDFLDAVVKFILASATNIYYRNAILPLI